MRVYKGKVQPPREWVEEIYRLCVANKIKLEFNAKHAPQALRELLSEEIANGNISSESSFFEEAITERVHQQNIQNPKYREWLELNYKKVSTAA